MCCIKGGRGVHVPDSSTIRATSTRHSPPHSLHMYSPFLNTCTHTHKQGHIRRNWKRRFFTLSRSSGTLTYYSKEEGGDRKGVFALQDSVVRLLPDHSKRLFLFEVVSATRVLRLSAQDEAERIAWCSALDPQFRVFQAMREYEQALQHLGEGVPLRQRRLLLLLVLLILLLSEISGMLIFLSKLLLPPFVVLSPPLS